MSNWSKEDSSVYNRSEIMQELEKRVIDTINRAEILNRKIAQMDPASPASKMKNLAENAAKATAAVAALKTQMVGLSDDGSLSDEADEVGDDVGDGELLNASQDDLINELQAMANLAIEEGNIKLAYRIERSIDELREEEVTCK